MPKLSVIVPVYQVEDYLALSLSSIRNQSFSDLEIICVNDGSMDRSTEILRMCATVEPRLKVIEKRNGGLSSARNAGIAAAAGEYLMFVDSDDMLAKQACATIFAAFEESGADIVTFGAHCYPEDSGDAWLTDCLSPRDIAYEGFDTGILFKEKSRPYVWRTAISRAFFERTGLLFDETVSFGEDQVFHFLAYPQAKKTVFLSDKLYYYRVSRADSLMACGHAETLRKLSDHLVIVERVITGWKTLGLMERYAPELLTWVLEFLIFDIYAQDPGDRTMLLCELRRILACNVDESELDNARFKTQTRKLLKTIMAKSEQGRAPRLSRAPMYLYYLEQRGLRQTLRRFVSGALHAKPLMFLYRCLRHILPTPASNMQRHLAEIAGTIQSDQQMTNALLLLTMEYAARETQGLSLSSSDVIPSGGAQAPQSRDL